MQQNDQPEKSCSHCATDIFEKKEPLWRQKKVLILSVSLVALVIGMYLEFVLLKESYVPIFYLFVIITAGYEIAKRALNSLLKKRFDMNFLMIIAAIGAFLTGHAEEGASVIFLFAAAELLEDYAGERARNSIAALLKLAPETARTKIDGNEVEIDVHQLKIGNIVIIKPGDRIPIDGIVSLGQSYVNEAPITGESVPSAKKEGKEVYAGTINGEGYLEVKVTKPSDQTVISKIATIVENAEKQKSKAERFVDKFASIYTPLVILASALIFLIPVFVFGQSFDNWSYRALVLLVTACPCALAISTPVSLVSGITAASKNGLLVKGGDYLEEAGKTKAVILDKTGTLTAGVFEVVDVLSLNGFNETEVLKIAASLESKSTHPIGIAIVKRAPKEQYPVSKFASLTGKGLQGIINGIEYFIGNTKLPVSIDTKTTEVMLALEKQGKSVVLLSTNEKTIGIIAVADRLKKEAPLLIEELKKLGIVPIMLTGDNKETAQAIASQLGISHFHAGLLPEEKLLEVNKLKKKYGSVMMVGDGVNDAPALAAASIGVAMGAIGSDVAIETADVAIMKDDLIKIPFLIKLGRKTMNVVKENIALSIGVKATLGILALLGIVSLWIAVAIGDMGLSLIVIINALRLAITKLRTEW
ncbi:MAG: heavy metal translocating P-type ATPase [Candidatus Bilamarchaeum sp.]